MLYPDLLFSVQEHLLLINDNEFLSHASTVNWLQIKNSMISWNESSSFQDLFLYVTERAILESVHHYIPTEWPISPFFNLSIDQYSEYFQTAVHQQPNEKQLAYWINLFNEYQKHLYQKKEIDMLRKNIWKDPKAWENLKALTQI